MLTNFRIGKKQGIFPMLSIVNKKCHLCPIRQQSKYKGKKIGYPIFSKSGHHPDFRNLGDVL